MSAVTPFLAEVRMMAFNFPPSGWALCNGQLLPINQNQALFSLLGTTYGGNGTTNFALPDLRRRVPMHFASDPGGSLNLGQVGGEVTHTLTINELPMHTHTPMSTSTSGDQNIPQNNLFANANLNAYAAASGQFQPLDPGSISTVGGSQAHENRAPFTVISFCIALQGIFPTRN